LRHAHFNNAQRRARGRKVPVSCIVVHVDPTAAVGAHHTGLMSPAAPSDAEPLVGNAFNGGRDVPASPTRP